MMRKALPEILARAAEVGDVVSIIYHGGSQPGSLRSIRPLSVTSDAVRAHDMAAGIDKTFSLSKIELPTAGTTAPTYDPAAQLKRRKGTDD